MLDPPSSGTPFIILPGNLWHFMTRHILSMSLYVLSPIRPEKPRKFHLCFTWCLFGFYWITDYQYITSYSSSLVFRSKRLALLRGVFVWGPGHLGLQGAIPETADYNPLTKHPSADRPQNPGVCGCSFYKMLIINVLWQNTPQTFCIVQKNDPAGGMYWQAKRHKETGLALIPGVDQYEVIIIFPSIRDIGGWSRQPQEYNWRHLQSRSPGMFSWRGIVSEA